MSFQLALVASLLSISSTVVAQELSSKTQICKAQPIHDSRVVGRAEKLIFPDGRELIVVGHNHGERQLQDVANMGEVKLAALSNAEFDEFLSKILQSNLKTYGETKAALGLGAQKPEQLRLSLKEKGLSQELLAPVVAEGVMDSSSTYSHALNDYSFLDDLVNQRRGYKRPSFVGLEADQGSEQASFSDISYGLNLLKSEYFKRLANHQTKVTVNDFSKVAISSAMGNLYYYMGNKNLWNQIPIRATESRKAVDDYLKNLNEGGFHESFQKLIKKDKKYWEHRSENEKKQFQAQKKNQVFGELLLLTHQDVQTTNMTPDRLKKSIQFLSKIAPAYISEEFSTLTDEWWKKLNAMMNRDLESAKFLASQGESGVHFVGLMHLSSTMRYLVEGCEKEAQSIEAALPPAQYYYGGSQKTPAYR